MQCNECGYQLSPFDKDCPRCRNYNAKQNTSATLLTSAVVAKSEEIIEPLSISQPKQSSALRAVILITVVGVLFTLALSGLFFAKQRSERLEQVAAKSQQTERLRSEGLSQCTAGDVDGCRYIMGKFRDVENYKDAEFLKMHLIVAVTLQHETERYDYAKNNGASSADYEKYSEEIHSAALMSAFQGDEATMRQLEEGDKCAVILSDYGKHRTENSKY